MKPEMDISSATICINCKNYYLEKGYSDPRECMSASDKHICRMQSSINYVTGQKIFSFVPCENKNISGNCPDYEKGLNQCF